MGTEGKKYVAAAEGAPHAGVAHAIEANSRTGMTDTTIYDEGAANVPEEPASMPIELQGHIGKHLRTLYGALVKEPVPEQIRLLLQKLAAREQEEKDS